MKLSSNKERKTKGGNVNIKVKQIPSKYKGIIGWDGRKLFVLKWKKH